MSVLKVCNKSCNYYLVKITIFFNVQEFQKYLLTVYVSDCPQEQLWFVTGEKEQLLVS